MIAILHSHSYGMLWNLSHASGNRIHFWGMFCVQVAWGHERQDYLTSLNVLEELKETNWSALDDEHVLDFMGKNGQPGMYRIVMQRFFFWHAVFVPKSLDLATLKSPRKARVICSLSAHHLCGVILLFQGSRDKSSERTAVGWSICHL